MIIAASETEAEGRTPSPFPSLETLPGRLPRRVIFVLLLAMALPFGLLVGGVDLGAAKIDWPLDPRDLIVQVLLGWTAACASLFTGLLALSYVAGQRSLSDSVLTAALLFAGTVDAGYVLSLYPVFAPSGQGPDAPYALWLLSRVAVASLLLLAGVAALRRADEASPRRGSSFVLATPVVALASVAVVWKLLGDGSFHTAVFPDLAIPRPWDLLPLVLFLFAGALALAALRRRPRSLFFQALALGLLPQIAAQAHMAFGSTEPFDDHFNAAVLLRLVGYLAPLTGLLLDSLHNHHQRAAVMTGLEQARGRLERQTQDLEATNHLLSREIQERQRAEEDLLVLRRAVETTQLGITVCDSEGLVLYTNPAEARMHGLSVQEMIGRPANLLGPAEHRKPLNLDELEEIPGFQRERDHFRADGSSFPVQLTSDIVRDASSRPMALVTICEDISERKRVEEELVRRGAVLGALSLAAERFLRGTDWENSVMEALALLAAALEVSSMFIFQNQYGGKGVAVRLRFYLGQPEAGHPDVGQEPGGFTFDDPQLSDLRRRLSEGQAVWGDLADFPCALPDVFADSGARSLLLNPVFLSTSWWGILGISEERRDRAWSMAELESLSTAARILGAALQRRQDERALRESEERFRNLFENATDLILSFDRRGNLQYLNRACLETLGLSEEQAYALRFEDLVTQEDVEKYNHLVERGVDGRKSDSVELTFVAQGGEQVIVEGGTSPLIREGKTLEIRGIFRDITRRKEIASLKRDFIATVSHELRTPLTSIYGSLKLLTGGTMGELPPKIRKLVEVADKNSQRLVRLVEDIIDVEKLDSGRLKFVFQEEDLEAIVEQAVEANLAYGDRFGVSLHIVQRTPGIIVQVDSDRLLQVLTNLLSNAVKFSPEGSAAEVSILRHQHRARVEVRDRGPGIPKDFRDRIFDRFVRAEPLEHRNREGTGLGLSIAKAIVERLEGEIGFEPLEDGTTFFFELPEVRRIEDEMPERLSGSDTQPMRALDRAQE